jgi:microcystin-dependent protein
MQRVEVVDRIATGDDEYIHVDLGGGKIQHVRAATVEEAGTVINRALFEALQDNIEKYICPPGSVMAFARQTAPDNWLACDGAEVSRETYADLFEAIGTEWGAGDGTTTFNLPDFRGYFLRGWAPSGGYDEGREWASYQGDQNKAHTHALAAVYYHGITGGSLDINSGGSYKSASKNTSSDGGTEVRVKNKTVLYCIKY